MLSTLIFFGPFFLIYFIVEIPFHSILRLVNYDVWRGIRLSNSLKNIWIHCSGYYYYVAMVKITYAYIYIYAEKYVRYIYNFK